MDTTTEKGLDKSAFLSAEAAGMAAAVGSGFLMVLVANAADIEIEATLSPFVSFFEILESKVILSPSPFRSKVFAWKLGGD